MPDSLRMGKNKPRDTRKDITKPSETAGGKRSKRHAVPGKRPTAWIEVERVETVGPMN
ncbi:MAG: hypothetical protein HQ536_04070 [Parcubacteria group bacterium]|nr:hypothetical protein [Parcubacteria group bacterium]